MFCVFLHFYMLYLFKILFWRILNVALHVAPDYATQSTSWFILPPLRATEFDEVASYCGPRALPGCRPFLFEGPQLLLPDRTFLKHIFPCNILGILPRSPVRFFRLFDNIGIWRQHYQNPWNLLNIYEHTVNMWIHFAKSHFYPDLRKNCASFRQERRTSLMTKENVLERCKDNNAELYNCANCVLVTTSALIQLKTSLGKILKSGKPKGFRWW